MQHRTARVTSLSKKQKETSNTVCIADMTDINYTQLTFYLCQFQIS